MIVYCEECGFKNIIDQTAGQRTQIACRKCGESLRFYGRKAEALKASAPAFNPIPSNCLILKYGKVVVIVNETNSRVEIGRQKGNDIQVVNDRVSRNHAWVEYKNGQFFLTDQSSNGTFLLIEGRKGITLKKQAVMLAANGVIGPGYKVDSKSPGAIHIWFEPPP